MEEQSRKVSTYCYLTFSGTRILKTPFRKLISECPRKSCGKLGTGSVRITLYRHFTGKQKNVRNPSESQEEFKLLKSFSELACGIWESGRQFKTCYRQHLQFATPVVSLKNPGYIFPHFKPPWETISLWLHWVLRVYWAYKRVKTGMNTDLCMHIHRYICIQTRAVGTDVFGWYRYTWNTTSGMGASFNRWIRQTEGICPLCYGCVTALSTPPKQLQVWVKAGLLTAGWDGTWPKGYQSPNCWMVIVYC